MLRMSRYAAVILDMVSAFAFIRSDAINVFVSYPRVGEAWKLGVLMEKRTTTTNLFC
jgi:hypothetical protein